MDFTARISDWRVQLQGFEAVVNCVGVLQDSPRENIASGTEALFRACAEAGVRRVLHFSAIGVDRHQLPGFFASKLAGVCNRSRSGSLHVAQGELAR